uniref:Uncharacterized protein n=1 Tax=Anguilla anguilla TaxID=7936 RepID=A0A0E9TL33_ANGAN
MLADQNRAQATTTTLLLI